jgi:hypothetical protein
MPWRETVEYESKPGYGLLITSSLQKKSHRIRVARQSVSSLLPPPLATLPKPISPPCGVGTTLTMV